MNRQLHELTKEELIEVVQDYQEMVSDIEEYLNDHPGFGFVTALRAVLDKERPGWKVHEKERQ